MDVKQEPSDSYEGDVKTEPDIVSAQTEGNDWCSIKQQPFKNEGFCDIDNNCEYQATEHSVNVGEIKQEIVECGVPKIEYRPSELPAKIDCDSKPFVSTTIKRELLDVDIGDIKQGVGEYVQAKTERELLTTYCELPILKSEATDYPDYFVLPCTSKNTGRAFKSLKTTTVLSKKRKRYPCPVCQKNLPSTKSRSKHVDGHFGNRSVVYFPSSKTRSKHIDGYFLNRFEICEFCGKLMNKIDFLRHYFIHVVKNGTRKTKLKNNIYEKSFKSDVCLKKINQKSKLNRHFQIHSFEKPFNLKTNLQQHLIINGNKKPFECYICSTKYTNKFNLQAHLLIHSNEKPFKCDVCLKGFKRKSSLKEHLIIHTNEEPFKCEICSKKYKRKSYLHKHFIMHTNDKPFKCAICLKRFNVKASLRQHLVIHTNEKPFKCAICLKRFNVKGSLQRHLVIHTNEKPFKCDFCLKEFKSKGNLQKHVILHTDKKPFECYICFKKCKRNAYLQKHLLTHTKEKPFKCDLCSKGFKLKSNLQKHFTVHSDKKPFECYICFIQYKRKYDLQRHINSSHCSDHYK